MARPPASLPRRKATIRYPYSGPGASFITICTQDRRALFGHVHNCEMHPNDIAAMVEEAWRELPRRYPGVCLDAMIIMPDHLHGVHYLGADPEIDLLPRRGDVVRYFKGQSTIRYCEQVRNGT